jgi:GntR family transcriptional regulator/MocR family aminotransferase
MRARYRARRDTLVEALAEVLPEAEIQGIAAGLHAAVRLPDADDERAIRAEASSRRIALGTMGEYRIDSARGRPTLLLGYAQSPEPTIRSGVIELARAVHAQRRTHARRHRR